MTTEVRGSGLALAACLALALAGAGEAARPQPRPGAGLPRAGPSLGAEEEAAALLERYGSLKGYHKALAFRHRAAHAEGCTQATGRPDCVSVTQGNETTYFESLAAFAGVPADEVAAWEALPDAWDWRDHGVVSAAKDQGRCGSCWAFASAEAMESHWALASGHLEDLSIQQILDCTPNPQHCGGTGGCHGSIPQLAFAQIDEQGGLAGEWSYGYTSYSGKDAPECAFAPEKLHATSSARGKTATVQLPSNQAAPLMQALVKFGPVPVSVDAGSWHLYKGGVWDKCNQKEPTLDHAVNLVGYGTDAKTGEDYWLVRNSWGAG